MEQQRLNALVSSKVFSTLETRAAKRIIKQIGNQEVDTLDTDDLTDLTSMDIDMMLELIELMIEENVLEFYDKESAEIG